MTLPASDSYETYGGELVDYSQVEDPNTDLSAEASNQMRASAAAMSSTCFRAILKFHLQSPGDGDFTPVIDDYFTVWNTESSDLPVITYISAGQYTIVFPTEVIDVRGNTQSLNLLGGIVNLDVVNYNGWFANAQKIDPTTFTIFIWSATNGVKEDVGNQPIELFVR